MRALRTLIANPEADAAAALLDGPTAAEDLGWVDGRPQIPGGTELRDVEVSDGTAVVAV